MSIEYRTVNMAKEPIIVADKVDASYGEIVDIVLPDGSVRRGKVISVNEKNALIEVFQGVSGINPKDVEVKVSGKSAEMELSPVILGRFFSGAYEPLDNKPPIMSSIKRDINGFVINPTYRKVPDRFIETGISSIDCLNSLIRGQKLAIFSSNSINNYEFATQLVKQSRIRDEGEEFAIVFCALGVPHDMAEFFRKEFSKDEYTNKVCSFINTASDPIIERITAPRYALTAAEYLAFDLGMHVLVILIDITMYCNALRELSSAKEEIPMRMGYPSYMYSDLATIYERCGVVKGKKGSITILPILTMPNDDITHPIPDLTGYITEGQIILSKELYKKGIYPPIDISPSLSRLMHKGIGKSKTREDHQEVANQIYASYAKAKQIKETASIVGFESLSDSDKKYLDFLNAFENKFLSQRIDEFRTIDKSLEIAWQILSILDPIDLTLIRDEFKRKYLEDINAVKNHNADK